MKKLFLAMVFSCIFALTAFAQQNNYQNSKLNPQNAGGGGGNGGGNTTSKSTSNSESGAAATITNNGPTDNRQLPGATPGVAAPGAFPSNPITPGEWNFYIPESSYTEGELEGFAKLHKLKEGRLVVAGKPSGASIHFLNWWPLSGTGPHLKSIAQSFGMGNPGSPSMEVVAQEILAARKEAKKHGYDINAIVCRYRVAPAMVTTETTKGLGITFSHMGGGDNNGSGASAGYAKGTNISGPVDRANVEILFFALPADGPFEWTSPQPAAGTTGSQSQQQSQPQPQSEKQPDASQGGSSAGPMTSSALSNQQTPSSTPEQPIVADVTPARRAARGSSVSTDPCPDMPGNFVILFSWDSAEIKEEVQENPWTKTIHKTRNREHLEEFVAWIRAHPGCVLQIEGYSCAKGSVKHDDNIAFSRAFAVQHELQRLLGDDALKYFPYLSLGKQFAGEEGDFADRKAIAVIRGKQSDWSWNRADYQ